MVPFTTFLDDLDELRLTIERFVAMYSLPRSQVRSGCVLCIREDVLRHIPVRCHQGTVRFIKAFYSYRGI